VYGGPWRRREIGGGTNGNTLSIRERGKEGCDVADEGDVEVVINKRSSERVEVEMASDGMKRGKRERRIKKYGRT
jgi:hypothetical protein